MSQPNATYIEDEHVYVWDDLDVKLTLERFREDRGELKADCQPESVSRGGVLPAEKVNLSSARSIKTYANTLGGYGLLDADQWFTLLTQACELSKRRYREGEPAQKLAQVNWRDRAQFVIYPYIEARGTTLWFGDGGVSKSVHALGGCLSVSTGLEVLPGSRPRITGPTVYLDWEADAETHAERLEALCASFEIDPPDNIIYMKRSASISESVREIRRVIALEGVVFGVVDSIGAAAGGDPERAETVIRAMNAIRALDIPILAIHHVTKDQKDKTKPFGSVYSPNLARLTWRLDKEQSEGSNLVRVRLTNFKGNNVRRLASKGHGVRFNTSGREGEEYLEEIAFTYVSGLDLPATGGRGHVKYEVARVLRETAGLTLDELCEELPELKRDTINRTLKRTPDWFVQHDDRWSLRAEDDADGQRPLSAQRPSAPRTNARTNADKPSVSAAQQIREHADKQPLSAALSGSTMRTDGAAPTKGAQSPRLSATDEEDPFEENFR